MVAVAFVLVLCARPFPVAAQGRAQFGDALLKVAAALAGEHGGTRAQIDGALEGAVQALARWDAAIRAFAMRVQTDSAGATLHDAALLRTSLGTMHFERGNFDAALAELTEATRLDAGLSNAWLLRGLTLDALGQERPAHDALGTSLAAAPDDAVVAYYVARSTADTDHRQQLLPASRVLLAARDRLAADLSTQRRAPFIDAGLIDDPSTKRPIFLPAEYGPVVSLLSSRRYDAALEALRQLIERDPLHTDPTLASKAFADAARELYEGRPAAALALLDGLIKGAEPSSEAHRLRSATYQALVQTDKAIAEMKAAVKVGPWNERAHVGLTTLLLESGEVEEAEQAAKSARSRFQNSAAIAWLQVKIAFALGRDTDVLDALEDSLRTGPLLGTGAASMWSALGQYQMRSGNAEAGLAFRRNAALGPNRAQPHLELGEFLHSQGLANEALAEFVAVLLIEPAQVQAHLSIGLMHLEAGRYAEAEATLRWTVARQPNLASARHALASALLHLGRTEEARGQLDAFKQLHTAALDSARNEMRLGVLKLDASLRRDSGQIEEAVTLMQRVVEVEPNVAGNYIVLADGLIRLGQLKLAAQHLERAGSLGAPPAVYLRLADLYDELGLSGERDRAAKNYELKQQDVRRSQGAVP